jgi:hypothetical protein
MNVGKRLIRKTTFLLTHWRRATEISVLRQPAVGDGPRRFPCLWTGGWRRGFVLFVFAFVVIQHNISLGKVCRGP